jgi:hypothetical protein
VAHGIALIAADHEPAMGRTEIHCQFREADDRKLRSDFGERSGDMKLMAYRNRWHKDPTLGG